MTLDHGRIQKGREITLAVELLSAPDSVPTYAVYNGDGLVLSGRLPADRQGEAYAFRLPLMLDGRFPDLGPHTAVLSWTVSGTPKAEARTFWITPGGSNDGAVIAMLAVRRPEAVRLIRQHDTGLTRQGRNPR